LLFLPSSHQLFLGGNSVRIEKSSVAKPEHDVLDCGCGRTNAKYSRSVHQRIECQGQQSASTRGPSAAFCTCGVQHPISVICFENSPDSRKGLCRHGQMNGFCWMLSIVPGGKSSSVCTN